jgi:XrtJ-associated TM-motif-TM protein
MLRLLTRLVAVSGISLMAAGIAWAQDGCVDSPENPTVVLGLLGAAAAGLPWLKARIASRLAKHSD